MCTGAIEGSGKDEGIAWKIRGIPFLDLCRLTGRRDSRLEFLLK
jgi:hypothetical protein